MNQDGMEKQDTDETQIPIKVGTRNRLKAIAQKDETYDAFINRILDEREAVRETAKEPTGTE